MSAPRCRYEDEPGVILDHLEGVLPEHEDEAFRAHLAGCIRCAGELRAYAEILSLARCEPVPPAAPGAETRIRAAMRARLTEQGEPRRARAPGWTWWRVAWAGGVVAAAAIVLMIMWAGERDRDPVHQQPVTVARDTLDGVAPREASPAPEPIPTRAEVAEAEDRIEEWEFTAYEESVIPEYDDDLAFEPLSPDAEEVFTRLVNEELETLLAKYGSQEQS